MILARTLLFALTLAVGSASAADGPALLNVSYDVTREFYKDFNAAFAAHWKSTTGETLVLNQSHGGSSKQIGSVVSGLAADVVTMNGVPDVDQLAKAALIPADWSKRLPNDSVPYTSTILFLVRKGNPKQVKDWSDLAREGVSVIIPNPKTSGNGRYSYLAAWAYALRQPGGSDATARALVQKIFRNVPVLDTGGRGASTTFAQRGIGDVLLTFENEAALTLKELGPDAIELVIPSVSVVAENPVVWVDKYVAKHGTEKAARAYLEFLFSPAGQALAVKHHFRPVDAALLAQNRAQFPDFPLVSVPQVFGSWA
ncbi:MAG: sulfate ABC transporter substrate-binding protein, partial [Verrucomicrobia bacterium]|nr:sulfate ABC transporter substrate-binding protein [Verrucomicrobiota bacterium]